MRIAIDFDGTIADTNQLHNAFCKKNFGIDLPIEGTVDPLRKILLTSDQITEVRQYIYGEATLQAPLVPGAREAIRKLAAEGHSILILTSRAKEGIHYPKEYMRLNRIPYNHLLYVSEKDDRFVVDETGEKIKLSKAVVIKRLDIDVMIEDQVKGLLEEKKDKTKVVINAIPILLTRPWNQNEKVQSGIIRLPNWKTIIEFLLTEAPAKAA